MQKLNCWEYLNCGYDNNDKNKVCPAVLRGEYDGINNGKHAGRICWAVVGTFKNSKVSCCIAEKLKDCLHCKFLKYVNNQEGREFVLLP